MPHSTAAVLTSPPSLSPSLLPFSPCFKQETARARTSAALSRSASSLGMSRSTTRWGGTATLPSLSGTGGSAGVPSLDLAPASTALLKRSKLSTSYGGRQSSASDTMSNASVPDTHQPMSMLCCLPTFQLSLALLALVRLHARLAPGLCRVCRASHGCTVPF
jgi:hypothetical protein